MTDAGYVCDICGKYDEADCAVRHSPRSDSLRCLCSTCHMVDHVTHEVRFVRDHVERDGIITAARVLGAHFPLKELREILGARKTS